MPRPENSPLPLAGQIRELKNVVELIVYRHRTSDYPLDEIIIDPFRRHTTQPQAPETKPMSVGLPLDLREFQQQQEKDFLQTSLTAGQNLTEKSR